MAPGSLVKLDDYRQVAPRGTPSRPGMTAAGFPNRSHAGRVQGGVGGGSGVNPLPPIPTCLTGGAD